VLSGAAGDASCSEAATEETGSCSFALAVAAIALPDSLNPSLIIASVFPTLGPQPLRRTIAFTVSAFAVTLAAGAVVALGLGDLVLPLLQRGPLSRPWSSSPDSHARSRRISHWDPAACRIADALPWQSYIVTLDPLLVFTVTARQVLATMLIAASLPVRVSPGAPNC
jgi:hypothetical protein